MVEVTEIMLEEGADAYHAAVETAIERAKARNDTHEAAGRCRPADEQAFPNDWLAEVYHAMSAAQLKTVLDREAATIKRYDDRLDDARAQGFREALEAAAKEANRLMAFGDGDTWLSRGILAIERPADAD